MSFDSEVFEYFKIFGRYTYNSPDLSKWYGVKSSWSTGVGFEQLFFNREFNIGVAYGKTALDDVSLSDETIAEFYAKHQLNRWVYISAHVQWIFDAGGYESDYTFAGLRTHFNF